MKKLLLFAVALVSVGFSELIPAARLGDWQPGITVGVQGGIPTNRTVLRNVVTEFGADNTGATNTTAAINSAISAATSGQVVYLPAGTYQVTNLGITYTKNNITLRGDGQGVTILDARSGTGLTLGVDCSWSSTGNPTTTITGGLTKGSTSITVASAAGFAVGKMVRIKIVNDPSIPAFATDGSPYTRVLTNRVTAIAGTTFTLGAPLPEGFSAATIVQTQYASQTGIGIEDMTITGANSAGALTRVIYEQGGIINSWLKNVQLKNSVNYGVTWYDSMFTEFRRCYVRDIPSTGSNKSCYLINTVSYSLYEDNIGRDGFPIWEVNQSVTNCVFAFNLNTSVGSNTGNLEHGPFNSYNLWEGNVSVNQKQDGYFGGGYRQTFHRNWINAANNGVATFGVALNRLTREYTFTGNIVQTSGLTYTYNSFSTGNPNIGNSSFDGSAEPSTGDWWLDWDATLNKPKEWTGILTTRTSATAGTITLDSSALATSFDARRVVAANNQSGLYYGTTPTRIGFLTFGSAPTGNDFPFTTASSTLPVAGTVVTLVPSPSGFQEIDLDVANTTIRKGDYDYFTNAMISLGGDTLPASLFRTSKPASWGSLSWPAFDPVALSPSITNIPAGYFYTNGAWPDAAPDTTPPIAVASIPSAGTTLVLNLNESTGAAGAGGTGGVTLTASGGAVTVGALSGFGTAVLTATTSRTIGLSETVTWSYSTANGIEDAAGNDLAPVSGGAVTNNSTQGGVPAALRNRVQQRINPRGVGF